MKYRVKEYRNKRGWSQEHLAEIVGSSKGYISQIETGARIPSAATLQALADAFNVTPPEMIEPDSDEAREAIAHLSVFLALSAEDRAAVTRIAIGLKPDGAS